MNTALINSVASRWARLGVMLNVAAAPATPDIERLLLDTARVAPAHSRVFIMAGTWLARHGDYVDTHRLVGLIRGDLEPEHGPVLGLLLEWARESGRSKGSRFNRAIRACGPAAPDPHPLFNIECRNDLFAKLARQRASALSLKWGRWAADFKPKDNALRPAEWIAQHNPALRARTLTA